jgi:hypothetical protein
MIKKRSIVIKVFSDTKTASKKKKKASAKPAINIIAPTTDTPEMHEPHLVSKPDLPDSSQKIGAFVYDTMRSLESVGYIFSSEEIDAMCTPDWTKEVFHTLKPFMKKYVPGVTDNKGTDGCVRFRSEPFIFGGQQVLISKEWYERQRQFFIDWYNSLA